MINGESFRAAGARLRSSWQDDDLPGKFVELEIRRKLRLLRRSVFVPSLCRIDELVPTTNFMSELGSIAEYMYQSVGSKLSALPAAAAAAAATASSNNDLCDQEVVIDSAAAASPSTEGGGDCGRIVDTGVSTSAEAAQTRFIEHDSQRLQPRSSSSTSTSSLFGFGRMILMRVWGAQNSEYDNNRTDELSSTGCHSRDRRQREICSNEQSKSPYRVTDNADLGALTGSMTNSEDEGVCEELANNGALSAAAPFEANQAAALEAAVGFDFKCGDGRWPPTSAPTVPAAMYHRRRHSSTALLAEDSFADGEDNDYEETDVAIDDENRYSSALGASIGDSRLSRGREDPRVSGDDASSPKKAVATSKRDRCCTSDDYDNDDCDDDIDDCDDYACEGEEEDDETSSGFYSDGSDYARSSTTATSLSLTANRWRRAQAFLLTSSAGGTYLRKGAAGELGNTAASHHESVRSTAGRAGASRLHRREPPAQQYRLDLLQRLKQGYRNVGSLRARATSAAAAAIGSATHTLRQEADSELRQQLWQEQQQTNDDLVVRNRKLCVPPPLPPSTTTTTTTNGSTPPSKPSSSPFQHPLAAVGGGVVESSSSKRLTRLCTHSELPAWLRNNEYLLASHRPPAHSYVACVRSLCQLHSETLNIWTHALGALASLVFGFYFVVYAGELLQWVVATAQRDVAIAGASDGSRIRRHEGVASWLRPFASSAARWTAGSGVASRWPVAGCALDVHDVVAFSVFFASASMCMGLSAIYHTLACHSRRVCSFTCKLDFAGITVLIFGSFWPWLYYTFYEHPALRCLYGLCGSASALAVLRLCLSETFAQAQWRAARATIYVAYALVCGVLPVVHYCALYGGERFAADAFAGRFACMAAAYVVGAVLYACRVPERWSPGAFDLIGHSHQLMHACVVAGCAAHFWGCYGLLGRRLATRIASGVDVVAAVGDAKSIDCGNWLRPDETDYSVLALGRPLWMLFLDWLYQQAA